MKRGLDLLKADLKTWGKWVLFAVALWAGLSVCLGTPCWVRWVFGVPCPFCGLTRAGFKLLCLDFAGAWAFQPMLFPVLGSLALLLAARYGCRRLFPIAVAVAVVCFCGCVAFYVWKMATVFPHVAPYVRDEHSLTEAIRTRFLRADFLLYCVKNFVNATSIHFGVCLV